MPSERFALTGLASGEAVTLYGRDARASEGDEAIDAGFFMRLVRLGVCGSVPVGGGRLLYGAVVEPWNLLERARTRDPGLAQAFGRFAALEVGYRPFSWGTLWLGIHKVAFSRGHDEPEETLPLSLRPYISTSVAPDRRLGLTVDTDLGAAHLAFGVYQGGRELIPDPARGLIVTDRLIAEPIGPLGPALSTVDDSAFWRRRPRFAVNSSGMLELGSGPVGWAFGGDLGFKWGPLGLALEYLYANRSFEQWPTGAVDGLRRTRQSLWLQAAWMLVRPYLELEARYEWFDAPRAPRNQFHAATVGFTLYVLGTRARLQTAYAHKFRLHGAIEDDLALVTVTLLR